METPMSHKSLLALAALALLGPSPAFAADAANPTVVELYQSQGCSSCPPANAVLNAIADRPDILALSFAVTYWDRLGWKDIYAHPAFTARQWEYSKAGKRDHVSTPQMIVNGRGVLIGHRQAEADAAIRQHARTGAAPAVQVGAGKVRIGAGRTGQPANVWLVRYDPRTHQVPIRAGENGGRTLPHKNIVRETHLLGKWTGTVADYKLPGGGSPILKSAILVQEGPGGAILAARRL
jgi:hypothetical protein